MIVFWVSILKSIINTYLCCKDLESLMYVIITVGLSIDMLFSESSVAIIGTGLYFILLGQYCKKINTEKICKINS